MSEILVTVKTYPEISKKHRETVCTAGILKDSKKLVRLYPIRFRYLKEKQQFSKYQWINAELENSSSDVRPESNKVNPDSIKANQKIGTGDQWVERCKWVLNENTVFESVEDLKKHQEQFNTSLGLVKPKEVTGVLIKEKTKEEIEGSQQKQNLAHQQLDLFETNDNDLDIIPYRFYLKFNCEDKNCTGHELSILDWEIAQLYRRLKNKENWKGKIKYKILDEIFDAKRETFLFLGNMARWHHIFCILGFFYPPKERQPTLF